MTDFPAAKPLVLFSAEGGMDIEEAAATHPASLRRHHAPLLRGFSRAEADAMLEGLDLGPARGANADLFVAL
jgi:succinyl-CoA synthetase beta subunit